MKTLAVKNKPTGCDGRVSVIGAISDVAAYNVRTAKAVNFTNLIMS